MSCRRGRPLLSGAAATRASTRGIIDRSIDLRAIVWGVDVGCQASMAATEGEAGRVDRGGGVRALPGPATATAQAAALRDPQFRCCSRLEARLLFTTGVCWKGVVMPLYMIERNFAEQLDVNADGVVAIRKINGDMGVNWLFSFLSADKRKTYCLYEAKDPEAIREAARRANIPADVIVAVSEINPERILAAAD
jgi:hypothetical protein